MNIGSTGSYISCPCDAVYAAAKSYILSVSKGISSELKGTGVTIQGNTVIIENDRQHDLFR